MKKYMTKKEYANFMAYLREEVYFRNYRLYDDEETARDIAWAIQEGRMFPHCVTPSDAWLLAREGYATIVAHYECGHKEEDPLQWEYLQVLRSWVEYGTERPELHLEVEGPCDDCYAIEEAKEMEAEVDPRFHKLMWVHCLDAYRGKSANTIRQHVKGFNALDKKAEVCCTDSAHMAGGVGLAITGIVTGLFDYDAWSEVSDEGKRYATRASFVGDCFEDFWATSEHSYYEAWVKDAQVEEVWVKEEVVTRHPRRLKAAYEMADRYRVPMRVFERDEVIYDPTAYGYAEGY